MKETFKIMLVILGVMNLVGAGYFGYLGISEKAFKAEVRGILFIIWGLIL